MAFRVTNGRTVRSFKLSQATLNCGSFGRMTDTFAGPAMTIRSNQFKGLRRYYLYRYVNAEVSVAGSFRGRQATGAIEVDAAPCLSSFRFTAVAAASIRTQARTTNTRRYLSLGGAASAARYVITSTSQIKPSVLTQLQGRVVGTHKQLELGALPRGASAEVIVRCPAGSSLTGGGGWVDNKLVLIANAPADMGRGWRIEGVATRAIGAGADIAVFAFRVLPDIGGVDGRAFTRAQPLDRGTLARSRAAKLQSP